MGGSSRKKQEQTGDKDGFGIKYRRTGSGAPRGRRSSVDPERKKRPENLEFVKTSRTDSSLSFLSSSLASRQSSVILDTDVQTIPGSPWSIPTKRTSVHRRSTPLNLASYSSSLALVIALGWVFYIFFNACWYYNSFGHVVVEIILGILTFFGILWNTYFTTTSFLKMFIPSQAFRENGAFYSIIPEEKHPEDDWASVTIQIPVYKESFEEVIGPTLVSCIISREHYNHHTSGACNIVVCDDGIMAMLRDEFEVAQLLWESVELSDNFRSTIESIRESFLPPSSEHLLQDIEMDDLDEVIRRMLFYFKHDIGFVARSTVDRRGKFKKASNLNTHLRIEFGAAQKQEEMMISRDEAIYQLTHDENGNQVVFCANDIQIGSFVVLNDADARMSPKVIAKTVPEFLNDPSLAFTQHSTKTMDSQRGESRFLRLIEVYTDALYQGHFLLASIMGCHPPLVGHSAFIRTDAIRQCGRMRTLRRAQKWLNNLGLHFLGANNISYDRLQCPVRSEYWSESHVSEDFELMIHLYNLGYKGRFVAYPDCEFQEGVTRTFDEEATRHRKFSLGAHELLFNPLHDILGQGIFTPLYRNFLTCDVPSYYKIYLASYLQSYVAGGIFLFVFTVSAIVKMVTFADAGSIFAQTPAAIIILSLFVYYIVGYTSFLVALLRMKKNNNLLFFAEYRELNSFQLVWKHVRYAMVFQFTFYFPMINIFFLGAMDHMLSRKRMVQATNKDSIDETRWTAVKNVIRCNWGNWTIATFVAAMAAGTMITHPKSIGSAAVFAIPALFISVTAFTVPFILNPYVWPSRPKNKPQAEKNENDSSGKSCHVEELQLSSNDESVECALRQGGLIL